jgi:predicted nucleic acid-binding protein
VIAFLDASIVIYLVERNPVWGPKAATRFAALLAAGDKPAVSDLIRMECRVGPLKSGNVVRLNEFATFFAAPDVLVLPVTPGVCDRASAIRAAHGFKPLDSLHLAAAVEHRCGLFLTSDSRLSKFTGLTVEVLT